MGSVFADERPAQAMAAYVLPLTAGEVSAIMWLCCRHYWVDAATQYLDHERQALVFRHVHEAWEFLDACEVDGWDFPGASPIFTSKLLTFTRQVARETTL